MTDRTPDSPAEFVLTVRVPGPDVTATLKRALKNLGRSYGVRCLGIRPADPGPEPDPRPDHEGRPR